MLYLGINRNLFNLRNKTWVSYTRDRDLNAETKLNDTLYIKSKKILQDARLFFEIENNDLDSLYDDLKVTIDTSDYKDESVDYLKMLWKMSKIEKSNNRILLIDKGLGICIICSIGNISYSNIKNTTTFTFKNVEFRRALKGTEVSKYVK